jgi:hypothetical protein
MRPRPWIVSPRTRWHLWVAAILLLIAALATFLNLYFGGVSGPLAHQPQAQFKMTSHGYVYKTAVFQSWESAYASIPENDPAYADPNADIGYAEAECGYSLEPAAGKSWLKLCISKESIWCTLTPKTPKDYRGHPATAAQQKVLTAVVLGAVAAHKDVVAMKCTVTPAKPTRTWINIPGVCTCASGIAIILCSTLLLLPLSIELLRRTPERALERGYCAHCGYEVGDLRIWTCPECGAQLPALSLSQPNG